jgi:Mn-containing catalase
VLDIARVVVRNNLAANNTGIGVPVTFSENGRPWRCREAGIVVEGNLCSDSVMGIAIEEGARAVERNNAFRNVAFPLTWGKAT